MAIDYSFIFNVDQTALISSDGSPKEIELGSYDALEMCSDRGAREMIRLSVLHND